MNEKDWKKDGLNPVFPLAGLMLLIRSHPVRPRGAPPTMCTRGCVCVRVGARVCVCVRVRAGAPVRVRAPVRVGAPVCAWVYAWWSRVRVGVRVVFPRAA